MICFPGTLFSTILRQNPIVKWNVPLNDSSRWYSVFYYSGPTSDRKVDPLLNALLPWHIVLYHFWPEGDRKVGPNRPKVKYPIGARHRKLRR